ncbi:sensor histidine kinase [Luteibaculum oceani]|uniref:histidine kinase n=1 Tax=Luteibaculum oceani TaxID=1294296 RepID=A0A5C6UTQ9_9FLAO|nr:HAMP domain-containing sensor histidine kinase [Luteibaculum oceani]TXC75621.1 HAMP domain-containing histidine kinase [Luteibaculum oceani]
MEKLRWHKSFYLFGLLFIYVLAQFIWWATLLYRQSVEIALLKNPSNLDKAISDSQFMIFGEGAVFLIILLVIIIYAFRSLNAELNLALRQKNFLLSISHELKTPIASIKSIVQTLLKRELDKDQQKKLLLGLENENQRLGGLIENVFVAQKITNGKFSVPTKDQNLGEFISQNWGQWTKAFNQKPELDLVPNLKAKVDLHAFELVMINLANNAFKYGGSDTIFRCSTQNNPKSVVIKVSNTGSEIPAKELDKIFDLFYRVGNEETRKTKGTGLGLYICRSIIKEHGGNIKVENNLNRGVTFEITLPSA